MGPARERGRYSEQQPWCLLATPQPRLSDGPVLAHPIINHYTEHLNTMLQIFF